MKTIEITEALYVELIDWFEKFNDNPVLHDQGLPQRLNDAAHKSIKARLAVPAEARTPDRRERHVTIVKRKTWGRDDDYCVIEVQTLIFKTGDHVDVMVTPVSPRGTT